MDVREKLVELFENHCAVIGEDNCKASQSGKCTPRDCAICLASDLIANGVTVQEWISVKDRLPDRDGWYITQTNATSRSNGTLPQEFEIRNGVGRWRYRDKISPWNTTHWQPMPQPPKGE